MTTGSYDRSVPPNTYFVKAWNGTDGKYTPDGIPKWNEYHMSLHDAVYTPTTGENQEYGFICPGGSNLPPFDSNLEIKALSKIVAKAKGHSFNLAVTVAESRQTIRLVKSTLLTVGQSAVALKRGDVKNAVRYLLNSDIVRTRTTPVERNSLARVARTSVRNLKTSDLMHKWLELQYGWLPLCNDVYEGMSALHAKNMRPTKTEIKSAAKGERSFDMSPSPTQYTLLMKYEEWCSVKYRWTSQIPVTSASLGLQDPMTVAWELLPFSFIADWFVPIGPYLEAVNQVPLLSGEILVTKFIKGENPTLTVLNHTNYEGCTSNYKWIQLDRLLSNGTGHTVPLPSVKTLEKSLSPLHIANGVALLQTILSPGKSSLRFTPQGF